MKLTTVILSAILLFCVSMLWAQDTEKDIQQIRKEYQRINKTKLTAKTIKWENNIEECQPYSSGTVVLYSENNKVVKIFAETYDDHGSRKDEYYFKDGKLIFIYKNSAWGGAENPDYYIAQVRLYIKDGVLIEKLQTASEKDIPMITVEDANLEIITSNALFKAKTEKQITSIMSCGVE